MKCNVMDHTSVTEDVPTSDHEVPGSNPTRGGIQPMTVRRLIAQSFSLSSFHHLNMT